MQTILIQLLALVAEGVIEGFKQAITEVTEERAQKAKEDENGRQM